ncbi:MAG: hypothetical protein JJLCMIEE_02817 [Acidimicrobiales bacterium]|nr:MAG: MarR family transcriptional regulator [Actinomycetota bacterium]MBV6509719.1 hypothetical protein [Acidimicrobiales bacterium]RIK02659.1 MAG: AsnC family transcriptional regulator [Acidobacteriota bacterium]
MTGPAPTSANQPRWTFLTNHAHVMLCIAKEPDIRLRDIALWVGISERAVHQIVKDLEAGGYVMRTRSGRRNHYRIHPDRPLRHPRENHHDVGELLTALAAGSPGRSTPRPAPRETW